MISCVLGVNQTRNLTRAGWRPTTCDAAQVPWSRAWELSSTTCDAAQVPWSSASELSCDGSSPTSCTKGTLDCVRLFVTGRPRQCFMWCTIFHPLSTGWKHWRHMFICDIERFMLLVRNEVTGSQVARKQISFFYECSAKPIFRIFSIKISG